jgi:type II secretory pathway component PulJ
MKPWRADSGYSLSDLLVATAVVGLVMAALLGILQSGTATYRWGAARVEAQQSARLALERVAKELRSAGYDPTSAGIAAVVTAEPSRVAFQWDLDGDGVVDPTRERVTFLLRPGESTLRRDAGGGAQPIITGVRRFALTYFDAAGLVTADPAAVAAIGIQIDVGLAGPGVTMRTQATLRNRGG